MKIDENVKKAIVHCLGGEGCHNCPYEFVDGCSAVEPLLYDINQLAIENEMLRSQKEMWESTAHCEKDRNKSVKRDTLSKVELCFSMRFGTYTKDDTIKVTEVFDTLEDITKRLTEE